MGVRSVLCFYQYNLASLSYVYGRYRPMVQGHCTAFTSGSSTTVTAFTGGPAGAMGFAGIVADDLMWFAGAQVVGVPSFTKRTVVTPGDATIVVDTAIDLGLTPGVSWMRSPVDRGTAITNGWVGIRNMIKPTVKVIGTTIANTGGLGIVVEGQLEGAPGATAGAVIVSHVMQSGDPAWNRIIEEPYIAIRVGLQGITDFTGTDDITVLIEGTDTGGGNY